MRVTTKTGDNGWTKLLFGRRVRKDDRRLRAIGALDELNSFLGLARCALRKKRARELVISIQNDLFIVASELAAWPLDVSRLEQRADDAMVERIEGEIEHLERTVRVGEYRFVVPGENKRSALLDVCRSVARRAERHVVAMRRDRSVPRTVLIYMNRLSDLLHLLARSEEKKLTAPRAGNAAKKRRPKR